MRPRMAAGRRAQALPADAVMAIDRARSPPGDVVADPRDAAEARGVLNDAVSIYFLDATLASAFVARWCAGSTAETQGGVFKMRDDRPTPRTTVAPLQTP